jgi:hypothetical protein
MAFYVAVFLVYPPLSLSFSLSSFMTVRCHRALMIIFYMVCDLSKAILSLIFICTQYIYPDVRYFFDV